MAFVAGTPLSAAALNAAILAGTRIPFTTTSPAGSGYLEPTASGTRMRIHWISTGNVAATTSVTPDYVIPVGSRPPTRCAVAAVAGSTSPRLATCAVDSDGTWQVYNGHSSATVINVDDEYPLT